jgi:hypothetical protein
MLVKEVNVAANPIAYGAELAFTTKSGAVDELQRRVQYVAEAYNSAGTEAADAPASERKEPPLDWPTPSFETEVQYEETPEGGRVKVTAADGANAEALRDHMEELARKMRQTGTCPSSLEQ